MLKNKWLTVIALMLLSLCAMMFVGCTLEEDIETLRAKVAGEKDPYNPYSGNTPTGGTGGTDVLSAPTGVTATVTYSSSITVSWNAVSGAYVYNIYRYTDSYSTYEYIGYTYSTSYTDTGLYANTTYYYKVAASNSDGEGPQSAYASATTWSSSGGGVPSAPTGVTATAASSSSITVSWNVVSGATGYYIYRSSSSSGTYTQVGTSTSTSYTNTGLSANTTYYYKVSAVNSYGTGSQSSYASATTSSGGSSGPVNVPGATLAAKLSWLESNAQSGGSYIVEVTANESISPTELSYSGKSNITITLRGTGAVRTVSLSSNGAMFSVADGSHVTLILDSNITLQGRSDNNATLVRISYSGTLVMNEGSRITGNTNSSSTSWGGGVYVSGTFTMNGGTISGNTSSYGGVRVDGNGTFTMNGGTISGNTAHEKGGGVYVHRIGTFVKTGGTIYGYSASDTTNSNVVKNYSGTVQSNKGHAVYADYNYGTEGTRRETTAGPSVNLSFNGSNDTFSGGWD